MDFNALFTAAQDATTALGGSFPRIDIEGTWVCKVTEAVYGKNQKGDANRGQVKLEVVDSLRGTEDRNTARTNVYITVAGKNELTVRNVAPWIKTLLDLGVSEEKIKEDATDMHDVIQNIITIITKQMKQGKEIKVVLSTKNDGKGSFYKNISPVELTATTTFEAPAPVAKPAKKKVEPTNSSMAKSTIANPVEPDEDTSWMEN